LWHQLTLKLENVVSTPAFDSGEDLLNLYNNFIKDFETKLNQLVLVKICLRIIAKADNEKKAEFLRQLSERLNPKLEKEAYALCLSGLASTLLELNRLDEAKALADKIQGILDTITGADHLVYSNYHRVLAQYYKRQVSPTEFYKNSLLYLVYTPIESIPAAEQNALAFDMGLAALVSRDIFNFGELLAHPVLNSLQGTPNAWLKDFLFAFNSGDVARYETFLQQNAKDISAQPALKGAENLLRQKVSILALIELVFNKPSEGRTISFDTIAKATKLPIGDVELLVMRAMSVKLTKGEIDGVDQTVTLTWVQPRVLDLEQVGKMKGRMESWTEQVKNVLYYMENQTSPELLA